jgi:hypothetical protein
MTYPESYSPSAIETQQEFLNGELFDAAAPDLMVGGSPGFDDITIVDPPGAAPSRFICTFRGCTNRPGSCTSYCLCSGHSCSTFPRNC